MGLQLFFVPLVAPDVPTERAGPRGWIATAALATSGIAHLAAAATIDGGVLQLVALAAALAQFAAAGFLACLALTDQRPSAAVVALLLAGTVGLVAVDLLGLSGLPVAAATLADVLVAVTGTALLTGFWRRRAQDVLLGLGALVWLLWLVGAVGAPG